MLFHRSSTGPRRSGSHIWNSQLLLTLLTLLAALAGLLTVAGCGGGSDGDKEDLVLALVGDTEITGAYYESKLGKLEAKELPRGESGMPLDMAENVGKTEFLSTLINKELMARKAEQLGYGADPQIKAVTESMTAYEAGLALWNDVVGEPAGVISPKQLEAFYARMGEVRDCNYLMTNFREQADEARQMARDGAEWDEVIAKYHEGAVPPKGKYEISIPYGRYNTEFDTDIFETEVGDVAPPILTNYGFWVMRVNEVRDTGKPDLEEAKAQILDIMRNRRIAAIRKEFIEQVRKEYEFFIDEDVLWIAYQGVPRDEVMLDPQTNKPTPKDQLLPLDVSPADMSRLFYGYTMNGERFEYTLGDYKGHFDRMSVFQRPKYADMLGGMRQKITQELDKALLNDAAKQRGFFEHPDVVDKVWAKAEEMMVTKLYDDVVVFEERITPEQLAAFWDEHVTDYYVPEARGGRMVVCNSEANALAAREMIVDGAKWRDVMTSYGVDKDNKSKAGRLNKIYERMQGPVPAAMFLMSLDQISDPVVLENGLFAVIQLESIDEGYQQDVADITESVGQRMRNIRKEEAFQKLLTEWADEFGVTRFEDRLEGVASWKELTTVELPGEVIPRN